MEDATDVGAGQREFINAVNAAWKGPRAAEVRLLPEELELTSLPAVVYDPNDKRIPYGVDELELARSTSRRWRSRTSSPSVGPSRASRTCSGCC